MGNWVSTTAKASEVLAHPQQYSTLARIRIYVPPSEPIVEEAVLPNSSLASFDTLVHYIASLGWRPAGVKIAPHLLGVETRLGRTFGPRVMALLDELWGEDMTHSRVVIEVFTTGNDARFEKGEESEVGEQAPADGNETADEKQTPGNNHLAGESAELGYDSSENGGVSGEAKLKDVKPQLDFQVAMPSPKQCGMTFNATDEPLNERSFHNERINAIQNISPPNTNASTSPHEDVQRHSQPSAHLSQIRSASNPPVAHDTNDELQKAKHKQVQAALDAAMAKTRKHFTPKWSEPRSTTTTVTPTSRVKTGNDIPGPNAVSKGCGATQANSADFQSASGRLNASHRGIGADIAQPVRQYGHIDNEAVSVGGSDGSGGVKVGSGCSSA